MLARSLWLISKNTFEVRPSELAAPTEDCLLVKTKYSAISRGTEGLISRGEVPENEYNRMRAPHQEGQFPWPVKYGYSNVGEVIEGPGHWVGRRVFCLYPHQDQFVLLASDFVSLPEGLPADRATLAANMETALNAIWDSGLTAGDHVAVIGGGMVGLLIAYLCDRFPATKVHVIDPKASARHVATELGLHALDPDDPDVAHLRESMDLVFHTSSTQSGLNLSIDLAGFETTVMEVSWYGERATEVKLGGAFHNRRIRLQSSQVGHVSPHRRMRRTYHQRLATALDLLCDDALDALLTHYIAFEETPKRLPDLLMPEAAAIGICLEY